MQNSFAMRIPLVALCLLAAALPARAAQDGTSLTVGIEQTKGDYGQGSDTTITTVPVTFRLGDRPWQFGVTVPYLEVRGPGNVTRDLGRFRGAAAPRSASGLGDVVAFATRAVGVAADGTALDLTGKVKLGTADEGKGLGTGENDFHLQADVYGSAGTLSPFGTLGYKVLGDPPGIDLKDVFFLELGVVRRLDGERSAGLMWHGQQKTTAGGAAQSELTAFYTLRMTAQWKLQFYGLLGLADGSPDFGAGAFLTRGF